MDFSQIIFILIMCTAILLFMTEWVRVDVVGLLIILSLAITGIITAAEALSGFSSEPAIIVGAVFVLSAGLTSTGATDMIGRFFWRISGSSEILATLVVMTGVALMSSVTHHLMITAMMVPIVMKLCREKGFSPSRMLIPTATAASLGTTLTLIGAPAFLLSNQIIKRSGAPELKLFSVAQVGLPLVVVSFAVITLLRWLLPKKTGQVQDEDRFKHSHISTEIVIPENSKWIGKTLAEMKESTNERFQLLTMFRGGRKTEMLDETVLSQNDEFLIDTDSDELVSIEEKLGLALRAVKEYGTPESKNGTSLAGEENNIVEAVIGPRSPLIGQTLSQIEFHSNHGVTVVALWRKEGWIRSKLSQIELRNGDLIVLWGTAESLEALSGKSDFLVFMPFHGKAKMRKRIPVAFAIMGISILVASIGILPAHIAFLTGALVMVLSGCVAIEDAYRSIETRVFIMIAGVIPLGIAMQKTGVDKLAADLILGWTQGLSPFWMVMIFFWFAALLTQILSDAATTIVIAPVAVIFAKSAGFSPVAAAVCVTIGAIASFLTPIGHHGNLLILKPGGYRFADFLKIGLPLTVVISVMTCFLSLQIWK